MVTEKKLHVAVIFGGRSGEHEVSLMSARSVLSVLDPARYEVTQVGITSFGDQNCAQFGADTRTDAEKAFLLDHIPQLECEYDSDCGEGKRCFQKKCIKTPFTEGGLGSECANAADCAEAICANDGEHAYCSATCNPTLDNACPDGLDCIDTGQGTGACWPTDTGCCSSTRKSAPTAFLAMAFLGVMLGRKRRRGQLAN